MSGNPLGLIKAALHADDAAQLSEVIERHPELKEHINDPVFDFDSPAIVQAAGRGNRRVMDVLLGAGADINARSRWWAGSFGVLDSANKKLAAYLIRRGAVVDVNAAARLGMLDKLRELVSANPELVHARGGDGQTPLHVASTVEIAKYLLEGGADIDARDIDHESTPAQYLIRSHPEVVRYLIERGCKTDILMAAAIDDEALVRRHLDADPECIRITVSDRFFPKQNPRSGGTIYIWTLGAFKSPHLVAGDARVVKLLMDRSPLDVKLVNSCLLGDGVTAKALAASYTATPEDAIQVAHGAEVNNTKAVRLLLACGFPVAGAGSATPLHWAAFHGNVAMARAILRYKPPLEQLDPEFKATPLHWAIYGSEYGWRCKTGNYAGTVEALLQAGAKAPEKVGGTEAVKEVLLRYRQ
jgi:hypothetical protein